MRKGRGHCRGVRLVYNLHVELPSADLRLPCLNRAIASTPAHLQVGSGYLYIGPGRDRRLSHRDLLAPCRDVDY